MVEAAHAGKPDNLRAERGSSLERPPVRRISEPRVNSLGVVVGDVLTKSPMQMPNDKAAGYEFEAGLELGCRAQ